MNYLSAEEILRLHHNLVEDYGGSHGVRDESRIKSVVEAPRMIAFGHEQYLTVWEKAAVYLRSIIADHPFVDGNKRTATTVCGIFLRRNAVPLTALPAELEDFAVRVATDKLSVEQIADWLKQHAERNN